MPDIVVDAAEFADHVRRFEALMALLEQQFACFDARRNPGDPDNFRALRAELAVLRAEQPAMTAAA